MQKKSGIPACILFLSVMLTNFASAQFYGGFSLSDFLNSIDESLIILGVIFLIVFTLVAYALGNVFKGNIAVSRSIAAAISLLVIWGVNRSGNYTNYFYSIVFFLPTGFIETIWPILVVGLIIVCWVRYGPLKGTSIFLIWAGILLIFLSFIGVFYESGGGFGIGILLLIIGLVIRFWKNISVRKKHPNRDENNNNWV